MVLAFVRRSTTLWGVRTAAWLFGLGLALRLLFWAAGPDGGAAWHIGFQSDAPIWQEQAARLASDALDAEMRLPWRPPLMLWIVSSVWDGQAGVWPLRLLLVLAGAAVGPLLWLLLRSHVDGAAARLAAEVCAVSSNLILLSSGLHAEGLYLPGLLLVLCLQNALTGRHRFWLPIGWGLAHGLLCLLRAEHLLFFAAFVVLGAVLRVRWTSLLLGVVTAAAAVAPWQWTAAGMVETFNEQGAVVVRRSLPWDEEAMQALQELPAFAWNDVVLLVDHTVSLRGGERVQAADLAIVEEAYGCRPEPLPVPLIALYGPLNFFVANAPEGARGGRWDALDREPPMAGGASRYPYWLRLRPGEHRQFSLGYPPHLDVALHGYARGLDEILADPAGWLARVGQKLRYAGYGAVGGFGGYALPIGLSGVRRPVDMVAPHTLWAEAWRLAVLLLAVFGVWRLRRERALWPLFVHAALTVAVIVCFFGYARHGALLLPAVWTGAAVVLAALLRQVAALRSAWSWVGLVALLLVLETVRAVTVSATMDGRPVNGLEPFGTRNFEMRTIEFD